MCLAGARRGNVRKRDPRQDYKRHWTYSSGLLWFVPVVPGSTGINVLWDYTVLNYSEELHR
jgi:hypothetical protein